MSRSPAAAQVLCSVAVASLQLSGPFEVPGAGIRLQVSLCSRCPALKHESSLAFFNPFMAPAGSPEAFQFPGGLRWLSRAAPRPGDLFAPRVEGSRRSWRSAWGRGKLVAGHGTRC